MKVEEVRKCSFERWYDDFKHVTIRSIILQLPDEFILYVLKDGIVLPKSGKASCSVISRNDSSDSDEEEEEVWDNIETEEPEAPHFPDFDEKIKNGIEKLGGKVFPKLNWSSPQDASWIAFNNSCCCKSVSDIYLLMKSSDFIIHDLTQRLVLCEDYEKDELRDSNLPLNETFYLVLRKWTEIDTSGEFRCFVKDGTLIGICQREHSSYYDHIGHYQDDIIEDIVTFFHKHIQAKFSCINYVFDIYRKKKGKVYLIDFNPFGIITDSLLFSWEELKNGSVKLNENGLPEFRFVNDNRGVQPRTISYHALPRDIVEMSTGEDSFKLVDLLKLKIDEQNVASSDDEIEENWKVL